MNNIIVITGASSGIGRATALECGKNGATVIVAARRAAALAEVVAEIKARGAKALAIPTDVTDEQAVKALADKAIEQFGRIDVWINNAAVSAFGEFDAIPSNVFRRVIEVNVLGYVNGIRAVLAHFKQQQSGIIINVASIVGAVGQSYASPYTLSKFAIRGLSEALRWEVEKYGIKVCTVLPGAIDTPLFQHAANYSGYATKALHPLYKAEEVAQKIYHLIQHPKSEIYVGRIPPLLANAHKIAPDFTAKRFASQVKRDHFQDKAAEPTEGNLFAPIVEPYKVSGGWK